MAALAATCTGAFNLRQTVLPIKSPRPMFGGTNYSAARSLISNKDLQKGRREVTVAATVVDGRVEIDDNPEAIISGEWTENFSLVCYDDLREYFEHRIFKDQLSPNMPIREVMSTSVRVATIDQTVEEIEKHFQVVSGGLPVMDDELRCIGLITKEDLGRASHGVSSTAGELMTSPPPTLSPEKTVRDGAALMLKKNIHSIAVINEHHEVIGILNRCDILQDFEVVP